MSQRQIAYLKEPHAEKMRFFEGVAAELGQGVALSTWPMSFRGFPETAAQAEACLARATASRRLKPQKV